jgi:ergothioneine biosynthesis protein EgtB
MISDLPAPAAHAVMLRYREVRDWTVALCEPLSAEDFVVQPTADVSPPKWHLGHTTWFFENFILREQLPGYRLFDEKLNWFFNSYYESQGPRILRSNRGNMTRPTTGTVLEYRRYVDRHMNEWLDGYSGEALPEDLRQLLTIGLQHEQQHQELLLTDLKYILGHNPLYPVYQPGPAPAKNGATRSAAPDWLEVAGGIYAIGNEGEGFCWDNELSRHKFYLEPFALAGRAVTNAEYLAFIEDGGYERHELWQMEGIEWARALEVKGPLYWHHHDGQWMEYTLSAGLQAVDPAAPVTHVSFYEADAFARWKGLRLPTEQEWETAARLYGHDGGNFVESRHWHPVAPRAGGHNQLLGDVWEWTNSAYLPYPGYPRYAGALGEYNGKFMINQMVLRGGSCATPASHVRVSYRNFFHADKRWQFTGIRLAR